MTGQPRFLPESFREYLQNSVGQKIYLNADDRHPCILQNVHTDYIVLSNAPKTNEPRQTYAIPIANIVSLQEVDGLGGLVVYLTR